MCFLEKYSEIYSVIPKYFCLRNVFRNWTVYKFIYFSFLIILNAVSKDSFINFAELFDIFKVLF